MSLKTLDNKLKILAKSLDGELTKDNTKGMLMTNGFEDRILRWNKNDLNYVINIYPEIKNDNINKWVFGASCWFDTDNSRFSKMTKIYDCRKQIKIIASFDNLANQALEFLNALTKDDLEKILDFDN